jgi:hypothetical protein
MCPKHTGVRLIGVANKTSYLGRLWALPNDSKHNEAGFLTISIDSLCLRVAQVPIDLEIWRYLCRQMDNRRQINRLLYPLLRMHACGIIIIMIISLASYVNLLYIMLWINFVSTSKKGQPPYKGQKACMLPMCPLFGSSTVLVYITLAIPLHGICLHISRHLQMLGCCTTSPDSICCHRRG